MSDHLVQPVVACLGSPIAGNPTQFVIERGMKHRELDWRVITCSVHPDHFEQAILGAKAMRFAGLKLLPPFDEIAIQWMDQVSEAAKHSGTIQVARRVENDWLGHDLRFESILSVVASMRLPENATIVLSGSANDTAYLRSLLISTTSPGTPLPGNPNGLQIQEFDSQLDPSRVVEILPFDAWIALSGPVPGFLKRKRTFKSSESHVFSLESHDAWRQFAHSKNLRYVEPIEFQSHWYAHMFHFWTASDLSAPLVREALDEYHPW